MTKTEERLLAGLLKAIKMNSRGWIEAIEVVSEDGVPIAYESDDARFNAEYVAAATAAICGAISAVIELMNSRGYKRVSVELEDGRRVLIRQYRGYYVVCLTKPNPNMGFIEVLMETYLSK
ncbi:MAG: roadblock/LC7 domain-containing protein [Nitrososphaeria archaeon]|nr:roadblock/LC7 domain-containing protein [Nitrososphaeria archaeon]MDW8021893.1 roadblock/LC7 domain-containing protein [Nitrososphaerota archaeon]